MTIYLDGRVAFEIGRHHEGSHLEPYSFGAAVVRGGLNLFAYGIDCQQPS